MEESRKKRSVLKRIVDSHILSLSLGLAGLTTFFFAEKERTSYENEVIVAENKEESPGNYLHFYAIALMSIGVLNGGRSAICRDDGKRYVPAK